MTTLEQAARMALEALQMCANGEDDVLLTRDALASLRQALEQPTVKDCLKVEPEQEPYCWKVLGVDSEFTGYYAEEEANATAKRIGSTCEAFPLYVRPQPLAVERERNFCARCGKRLSGADHIHTCTPPQPAPTVFGSTYDAGSDRHFARAIEAKLKEKNTCPVQTIAPALVFVRLFTMKFVKGVAEPTLKSRNGIQ